MIKAIVLQPGTKNLRLADWKEPIIQKESEIKAKVLRVGICGTDREEASGGRADSPPGEKELVIGHEMLGQVVEIGKKVTRFKVGDFVVITVRRGCGACAPCHLNRSDMCLTGNYTERGIKGAHGFHSHFVVDDESFALKIPPEIAEIGVLTEPMSVVQKAIEEAGLIQKSRLPSLQNSPNWLQGKKVLVAGLGPIGLLACLVLRLKGATLFGLDIISPDSPRAKILTAIGGTYINDRTITPEKFRKDHPDLSLIFDAAGIAKLDFDLIDLLGINGVFVLTGVPGDQRLVSVDGAKLMRQMVLRNQVMLGSVNESIHHFELGIKDLQSAFHKWPGVVEKLITQRYPYTDFQKALTTHTADEIKVVIEWN